MKTTAIFLGLVIGALGCQDPDEYYRQPLSCDSHVVDTPDGLRLLVECNRDVENPPAECVPQGDGAYSCNTYHADEAFCKTFPGTCVSPPVL